MTYVCCLKQYINYTYDVHISVCMPEQKRKRVNLLLPIDLYIKINESKLGITETIISSLELYFRQPDPTPIQIESTISQQPGLFQQSQQNEDLIKLYESRIDDLKTQITDLNDQLHTKDSQIDKLNENLRGQVANIYNLTKDNPKLLSDKFW
jgi:hypothetical protein